MKRFSSGALPTVCHPYQHYRNRPICGLLLQHLTAPSPSQFDQVGFGVSAFVEVLKNVCEIAAIAAGGIWTYFNFFKGRTYKSTLECEVDGLIETHSGRSLLKVVVKAKNVGLSKVLIEKKGMVLQPHPAVAPKSSPSWPCHATWSGDLAVFDVFNDHAWIEPSEPIEDQVLVELPDDKTPAYKLMLRVQSGTIWWTVATENAEMFAATGMVRIGILLGREILFFR